mmetsp:Transcript_3462/g.4021  ORF Transcript_3462/g.4021 Transcript_3462/m.4021 type:complete len:151 (+) Transcript_3462:1083-1535(+)
MRSDADVVAELNRIRQLENYATTTLFGTTDPRTMMPGHAEIEVFAPSHGSALPSHQYGSTLQENPLLPMLNLSPLSTADLGQSIPVFILGFVVIAVGIYIAKKLQVFGGTLITKSDRALIEKAKRALGLSNRQAPPLHYVSADRDLTDRV